MKTPTFFSFASLFDASIAEMKALFARHQPVAWGLFVILYILFTPYLLNSAGIAVPGRALFGIVFFVAQLIVPLMIILFIKQRTMKALSLSQLASQAVSLVPGYIVLSIVLFFIVGGGLFLFLIPGIVMSIWFMFSQYSLVYDNKRGMNALMWSRQLIKGYTLRIFGYLFVFGLIQAVISGVVAQFAKSSGSTGIVAMLVYVAFIVLMTMYQVVLMGLLYERLRTIKASMKVTVKKWPYVVTATVGWIVGIILIIFLAAFFVMVVQKIVTEQGGIPFPTPLMQQGLQYPKSL